MCILVKLFEIQLHGASLEQITEERDCIGIVRVSTHLQFLRHSFMLCSGRKYSHYLSLSWYLFGSSWLEKIDYLVLAQNVNIWQLKQPNCYKSHTAKQIKFTFFPNLGTSTLKHMDYLVRNVQIVQCLSIKLIVNTFSHRIYHVMQILAYFWNKQFYLSAKVLNKHNLNL